MAREAERSCEISGVLPLDLLDPQKIFSLKVTVDLAGGDYHTKKYLASEKGHKYVKQINPTLESVKPFLDNMKEPSVLLLRGCGFLLQSGRLVFEKFKSLTTLEISGCRHLTSLPENTISQMTHLQSLDLSYLQINHLPDDLFGNIASNLRSLVLTGCSNLDVLPKPAQTLEMLEYLDLSHLPIQSFSSGLVPSGLRSLILKGCYKLHMLPSSVANSRIQFLDLSHCTSLSAREIEYPGAVEVLDISFTTFNWESLPGTLSHLFFRNTNLCITKPRYRPMYFMKVCNLSGSKDLKDVSMLAGCHDLEALDLSQTGIESIRFLSDFTSLRVLVLKKCSSLKHLPAINGLGKLEVLDLSGCEILSDLPQGLSSQRWLKELNLRGCKGLIELRTSLFIQMYSLKKLDISNTNFRHLPSFSSLKNRGIVIKYSHESLHATDIAPAEQSSLVNLHGDNIDHRHEFHLLSTFVSNSEFEKFRYKFTELKRYVWFLKEKIRKSGVHTEAVVEMHFESIGVDLKYILGKIDLLESSQNCRNCEKLLHELMSYDYDNLDDPSSLLKKLLRTVAKLKLLIPHLPPLLPPPKSLNVEEHLEKLKPPPLMKTQYHIESYLHMSDMRLVDPYESLTSVQRDCLLYFACLPIPIRGDNPIRESILIHLWYAEGFLDSLLNAESTSNTHRSNANQQVSTSNSSSKIGDIGREVLQALHANGFIYNSNGNRKWFMRVEAHAFVITKAMEEHAFDFNKRGKLIPEFGVSRRACMLKLEIDHPPSSHIWLSYIKSSVQLESFKTVRTLLYIDEHVVDINTEWFSSMTNLHVLHLVNQFSEQINIVDLKFLEELKRMKQLKLLNLESFAAIEKLPDSICELTNLRILNLAYCSNLVELPDGIASLTHLIILDLTQCHLLPQLPKGLASLTKLEVLKGFPITYKASGRQSKKACTLRALLMLKSLRKLNLVVNRDSFPDNRDLQVLRSMRELRNLKITWYPAIYKEEELEDAVEKRALRQPRWKIMKCWGSHSDTEEVEEEEELMVTNNNLGNINKLVLCCFPLETEPNWLHPTEFQKLERLYIFGGNLRKLFQCYTDQTIWSVKTLRFKYLSNLHMDWTTLEGNFPSLTSRKQHGCPHMQNFTQDTKFWSPKS